ncbi:hypothetical protein LC653_31845 [Nostoc sp. CHAB 5784]|uniref:hypothetical protein n=1 Tax=Nostoc mirabile TaxID=2907820 RepID=UPI001E4FC8D0|nr:hypothetical protein [Nostoc mirabile]MCC5668329.1 hypothetical protein [Nostoc mirabile CHAB5784]
MSHRQKHFVTKEELMVERTPQELVEWFERKIQEITQQEGGKSAIRMREGYCKQLMEEIYPLSIFAFWQFGDKSDVTLQPVIGSQNYDVLIIDRASVPPYESKLEITLALGDEYLKRLMLQEKGWSPISGYIEKTGTKNKDRHLTPHLGVRGLEDYLDKQINLIGQALAVKLQKEYETNTSLLIMFEDAIAFDETDIKETLYCFIKNKLETEQTQFLHLYLVSSPKRIFIKWTPNNTSHSH